ncbi:MAG: right-handed parallel beta-helix repeat-containing protein, partial [Bryobacteraceae bacterium]|nr:right-handed parallel beta-helix repeat-containing protein [Bryobacteraceae bacterium]
AARRGVHIVADNAGVVKDVAVEGLYIHDVNGTNKRKDNGGIIFRTNGNKTPSRFEGLTIARNLIWKVDRSAIAGVSYHAMRTRWNPSLRVVIRDNHVEDIGGDGIVPWATDGALVEHNIAKGCNKRSQTYNAGIWPWSTDNTLMRLNRASFTRTTMDGQGFDSDYNSRNTIIEYNLSHDNEGGFLLICTPGKRNQAENLGNQGTIARYNISRNDRTRTFHAGGAAERTQVYGNAIYIGPGLDVQLVLIADWSGWPKGLEFRDNLFHSEGTARYGHEISRAKDGTYGLGPGWGPAEGVVFSGNSYEGNHVDKPEDKAPSKAPKALKESDWNWPGPQLDPAKPEKFASYIKAHRAWMVRLMERQHGVKLK